MAGDVKLAGDKLSPSDRSVSLVIKDVNARDFPLLGRFLTAFQNPGQEIG